MSAMHSAIVRKFGKSSGPLGGVIALTVQPRRRGATADDTRAAAERMAASLRAAGFGEVRTEIPEMAPAAACVLARQALV